jgi:DNA-binding response OmpR family regulator
MIGTVTGNIEKSGVQLPKARIKLLVIEDDKSLVELLEILFTDEGYLFTILQHTNDILGLVSEFSPDIIILDYLLPHFNGGELCRQLKISKEYIQIPVIIFSAYPRKMMVIEEEGYDAFIEKPFDLTALINIIEDLCRKRPDR